ncbi:hypothetical protein JG688_00010128 [Phytophthora aleatoria]|uniref:Uncharacterized protein n=1 Tax=Phytophthora aleatoria TaxID=2496075 RepID=A0A8J5MF80_9STRA|nr:hypothetical protein JG688_00010128 [Phytophthora aleatoria]
MPWAKNIIRNQPMPIEILGKWVAKTYVKYSLTRRYKVKDSMLMKVVNKIKQCGYKKFTLDHVKYKLHCMRGKYMQVQKLGVRSTELERFPDFFDGFHAKYEEVSKQSCRWNSEARAILVDWLDRHYAEYINSSSKLMLLYCDEDLMPALIYSGYQYTEKMVQEKIKYLRQHHDSFVKTGELHICLDQFDGIGEIFERCTHDKKNDFGEEDANIYEEKAPVPSNDSETETEDEFGSCEIDDDSPNIQDNALEALAAAGLYGI